MSAARVAGIAIAVAFCGPSVEALGSILQSPGSGDATILEAIGMDRGVDRIDLDRAMRILRQEMEQSEDPRERAMLEARIRSIQGRLAHRAGSVSGYAPAMPALLGVPQLLEFLGDPSDTALEHGIAGSIEVSNAGLLDDDRFHIAILSAEGSESDEALVLMALHRATSQELLDASALDGLLTKEQIDALRRSPGPLGALQALAESLEEAGAGRVRVGVLQVGEPRVVGRVAAREVVGRFLSEDGQSISSRAATGFAEGVPISAWVSPWMFILVVPIQLIVVWGVRCADRLLGAATPPPWWLAAASAVLGFVIATMIGRGVAAVGLDPETALATPRGLATLIGTSAALGLLPSGVVLLAAGRVASLSARLGNADLLATLLVGSMLGSFAWIADQSVARLGIHAGWLPTVSGTASLAFMATVLGLASGRALRGESGWTLASVVAAIGCLAVIVAALRFDVWGAPLTSAVAGMLVFLFRLAAARIGSEALVASLSDGDDSTIAPGSLRARLACPVYRETPSLMEGLRAAEDLITRDESDGLRVLLVTGRSGAGKTRFIRECIDRLVERGERVELFYGDCDDPAAGPVTMPFEPFQQALGSLLGVSAMAGPGEAMRRLQSGVAAKGLQAALGTVGMGSLAGLLDASGDESAARAAGLGEIASAIGKVLRHRSGGGSLVLTIDDCQWIDPDSESVLRALLQQLATSGSSGRISIALLTRSDSDAVERVKRLLPSAATVSCVALDEVLEREGVALRGSMLEALGLDTLSRRRFEAELDHRTIENPASILSFVALAGSRGALEQHGSAIVLQDSADLSSMPPIDDPAVSLQAAASDLDH
ncbi:MAG: AAA family ATPase [Phycisphaerales bacterium]